MTAQDAEISNCPCLDLPLSRVAQLVRAYSSEEDATGAADEESFERLIRWMRETDLPCSKKTALCRLNAARDILQAIRDSFPVVEEPTANNNNRTTTAGGGQVASTTHSGNRKRITPKLAVNDTHAFPPLAPAAATTATTSGPAKKGKRRIRPAMISTAPLTRGAANSDDRNTWGSETTASAWPGTGNGTTSGGGSSNLLERRLSSDTRPNESPSPPSPTPTKTKPTVPSTPTPAEPTLKDDKDSIDWTELLQKPPASSLVRLVELYTTLVEASLVHSTPSEVHYVLSLLRDATFKNNTWKMPVRPSFELIRTQEDDDDERNWRKTCVQFSALFLSKLSYRLIRWGFATQLTECPTIQKFCPDLYRKAQDYLTNTANQLRQSTPRTTAFWTLPFNEMRDSRNRYKTQDELALYKNREESRDSFLSHLRSFYNQGSSVHLAASKSTEQVREAARSVLDPLRDDNVPWLAEFFTDMLLQLGSVPVQETDREVLKMADQDKVQKLHQRFKSPAPRKGNNRGGRNKKPNPAIHQASQTTAVQEEFFRGHQEFFYYFVMLADSHKLNHHLRHQFLDKIYRMSSELSSSNIDRRLEDLCLLAKFLGVLIFSPNWRSLSLDESQSRSLVYDELDLLRVGNKSMTQLLDDSWKSCRLISVVPWLTEMLRMSVWDEAFRGTKSFREVSGLLRLIQRKTAREQLRVSQDCKEVLLLCLESFVDEIAGLDWSEGLKPNHFEAKSSEGGWESNGVDTESHSFERVTIASMNGRSENVLNMVTDLTRSSRGFLRSPGVSRKVRPSVVVADREEKKAKPVTPDPEVDSETKVQIELRDSFFHLHRDLRIICEFAVDRVASNLLEFWKSVPLERSLVWQPDESLDRTATWLMLEKKYSDCMRTELTRCLDMSIALFAPHIHEDVKRIAISISVDQGMERGRPKLEAALSAAISAANADHMRVQKTKLFDKDSETSASNLSHVVVGMEAVHRQMEKYINDPNDSKDELLGSLQNARSFLDDWIAMENPENPPEEDLRSFYSIIDSLDSSSASFLERLVRTTVIDQHNWSILTELFRIAARSSHLCSYGFHSVKLALANMSTLSWLITSGENFDENVKDLIQDLCQARLIPVRLESEAMRVAGHSGR